MMKIYNTNLFLLLIVVVSFSKTADAFIIHPEMCPLLKEQHKKDFEHLDHIIPESKRDKISKSRREKLLGIDNFTQKTISDDDNNNNNRDHRMKVYSIQDIGTIVDKDSDYYYVVSSKMPSTKKKTKKSISPPSKTKKTNQINGHPLLDKLTKQFEKQIANTIPIDPNS